MKALISLCIFGITTAAVFLVMYALINLGLIWFGVPGAIIVGLLLIGRF